MDVFKWQPNYFQWLLVLSLLHQTKTPEFRGEIKKYAFNPCCYFPCKNGGICNEGKSDYFCDCTHTGFYGKTCNFRIWSLFFWNKLDNLLEYLLFNPLSSFIINNLDFLHTIFHSIFVENLVEKLEGHYFSSTSSQYLNLANAYNTCIGTQLLPPVPNFCPTPLGNQGLKKLPSVDTVFKNLLERNDFVKNRKSLNLLFVIFGQNLALQFKHCNYVTWITCSQIYSQNERSYKQGKLTTHIKQGEEFPKVSRDQLGWIARGERAKPNYLVSQNTLTFLISTIWLREHNRICDTLLSLWPDWDDEKLFQTARNIVTGELLAITYSEWIKCFSHVPIDLRYKPLKYPSIVSNTVPIEIYMAFHWPHTFPDEFPLDEIPTNSSNLILALEPSQIYKHGVYKMLASLAKMQAGQVGPQSISKNLAGVTKMLINEGRYYKLPSFNQYRSYFKLRRYRKFSELVGNKKLNAELTKMYGNVDGLEFITVMTVICSVKRLITSLQTGFLRR
ncbi:prostaglandin G/H synthase 2-like isoform X2 [Cimex lectularius]|uniref:prostaglandin-endoperoxide synthase n=1 Tax=Cimex lectularius TaxID=79782 RepID=A0A8I6S537_CIMLE|nr:prostaglandin G/H synthase 2-like isoform X2 [Cimex lectularius]